MRWFKLTLAVALIWTSLEIVPLKKSVTHLKVTMYPPAPVHTITTEDFALKAPEAYQYLTQRSFTNKQMSHMLAWMEKNAADEEEAMYYFFETYPEIWKSWVPAAAAKRIEAAL